MKLTLVALPLLLLALAAASPGEYGEEFGLHDMAVSTVGYEPPTPCCSAYIARKIPQKLIADYYRTSSNCHRPGVVFIFKKGRSICADPNAQWVRDLMRYIDSIKNSISASTTVPTPIP